MQVTWLASYPKSGNTWLRFFLYAYRYGVPRESNELDQRIPDLHALDRQRGLDGFGERVLCKTHLLMNPRHPFQTETTGFIHILRHPKDVLLSNLNYALIGDENLDRRAFAEDFIAGMGVPRWKSAGMGDWPGHLASWEQAASRFPHLFLRFEHMKANPQAEFARVVEFLGWPRDDAKLAEVVEAVSLPKLRAMEERERQAGKISRIFYTAYETSARFINRGASGQSLEPLGEGLDRLFDDRFRQELIRLGFETPA